MLLQQRAKEVVEWRTYQEEQQNLLKEEHAIKQKMKLHLEEYHKKREGLSHLNWRERRAALYQAYRTQQQMGASEKPQSEKTQSKQCSFPIIIKGTCFR